MGRKEFTAKLEPGGEGGSWTLVTIPFDAASEYGTRGRVSVKGTINGHPFRTSILPSGGGTFHMMVNKAMRTGAGAGPGDTVRVVMEKDDAPRTVEVPADFARALKKSPGAKAAFEAMSFSHRKAYVDAVVEAKKPETRARRIEKAIEALSAAPKPKAQR